VTVHYLLIYEVVDNYVEKRQPFRFAHLEKAKAAAKRGELVLGGALTDPVDEALLLFRGASQEVAADFARNDPYVINGLVKKWRVRTWNTVIGTALDE